MSDKQTGTADENTICPIALAGDHVVECGEYGDCCFCPADVVERLGSIKDVLNDIETSLEVLNEGIAQLQS